MFPRRRSKADDNAEEIHSQQRFRRSNVVSAGYESLSSSSEETRNKVGNSCLLFGSAEEDQATTTEQKSNADCNARHENNSDPCYVRLLRATDLQRVWTLSLFAATTVLLFADQNLLAPNLSQAAEEFGFDDVERDEKLGGNIALAFFLLGAPASLLVGCAADSDSVSRNWLFGAVVLIGEGACMATYFTTTYGGLVATRALTGFSVGGALPLLSSVLADWYPPERRSAVMALVGIGTGLGISFGQGLSGLLGPVFGWRFPFLVIGIPAIFAALLIMTTVADPERGGQEKIGLEKEKTEASRKSMHRSKEVDLDRVLESNGSANSADNRFEKVVRQGGGSNNELRENNNIAGINVGDSSDDDTEKTEHRVYGKHGSNHQHCCGRLRGVDPSAYSQHLRTCTELLRTKSVLLILVQGAPGCIPWGIVNTFLTDYLAKDCGMTVQAATGVVLFLGVGVFGGMVTGGVVGDYLYRKDSRYPSLFSGTMAMLGCMPLWILLNNATNAASDNGGGERQPSLRVLAQTALAALSTGVFAGVTGPIVKATLQNVTLPNARGQAFALLNTFDDFGRGLGPVFIVMLISAAGGRRAAFNVGVSGWMLCGVLNSCLFFTVRADEERTRRLFRERHNNNR